ncbi:ASN_collapsed_G0006570.mRNA.1.CDS.1 [Saccharomyces cerevisiae]|nr:ASN_collapsed_G0006570.mRNA.1.CDS.1 [Saccharomyces cerevisiae]
MTASVSNTQNKLNELLDAIRQEFLQVSQEANTYRLQNQKDYDFKMNQQLAEMQQIRNTLPTTTLPVVSSNAQQQLPQQQLQQQQLQQQQPPPQPSTDLLLLKRALLYPLSRHLNLR